MSFCILQVMRCSMPCGVQGGERLPTVPLEYLPTYLPTCPPPLNVIQHTWCMNYYKSKQNLKKEKKNWEHKRMYSILMVSNEHNIILTYTLASLLCTHTLCNKLLARYFKTQHLVHNKNLWPGNFFIHKFQVEISSIFYNYYNCRFKWIAQFYCLNLDMASWDMIDLCGEGH